MSPALRLARGGGLQGRLLLPAQRRAPARRPARGTRPCWPGRWTRARSPARRRRGPPAPSCAIGQDEYGKQWLAKQAQQIRTAPLPPRAKTGLQSSAAQSGRWRCARYTSTSPSTSVWPVCTMDSSASTADVEKSSSALRGARRGAGGARSSARRQTPSVGLPGRRPPRAVGRVHPLWRPHERIQQRLRSHALVDGLGDGAAIQVLRGRRLYVRHGGAPSEATGERWATAAAAKPLICRVASLGGALGAVKVDRLVVREEERREREAFREGHGGRVPPDLQTLALRRRGELSALGRAKERIFTGPHRSSWGAKRSCQKAGLSREADDHCCKGGGQPLLPERRPRSAP